MPKYHWTIHVRDSFGVTGRIERDCAQYELFNELKDVPFAVTAIERKYRVKEA